jgi:thiosulfate/3-mercaptopyruvate sulfurtransferase
MLTTLLLALALAPAAEKGPAYAKPELLVEPADLAKPAARKKFVILDARAKKAYTAGHVPGALWVDVAGWGKAFAKGQDKDEWGKRVGGLGIDVGVPVVVYGPAKTPEAARLWWLLRYWGVKDVRLLNGGWEAWQASKGEAEKTENKPTAVTPKLKPQAERLATKEDLLTHLKKGGLGQVIDTRSEKEHCGDDDRAKRSGTVPGSKHLEWVNLLDAKTGRLKTAPAIIKLFEGAGIDPKKPATTFCQSGGRASVMAFTYELMTGKPARNYYRSWAEWGNDDKTPIVKPKK